MWQESHIHSSILILTLTLVFTRSMLKGIHIWWTVMEALYGYLWFVFVLSVICVDKRMDYPETFYWNRPYETRNKHGNGSWWQGMIDKVMYPAAAHIFETLQKTFKFFSCCLYETFKVVENADHPLKFKICKPSKVCRLSVWGGAGA